MNLFGVDLEEMNSRSLFYLVTIIVSIRAFLEKMVNADEAQEMGMA
jgi:hypothetical protein